MANCWYIFLVKKAKGKSCSGILRCSSKSEVFPNISTKEPIGIHPKTNLVSPIFLS
ncbi:hypothetical protein D3C86_1766340 [compost metagenome]